MGGRLGGQTEGIGPQPSQGVGHNLGVMALTADEPLTAESFDHRAQRRSSQVGIEFAVDHPVFLKAPDSSDRAFDVTLAKVGE